MNANDKHETYMHYTGCAEHWVQRMRLRFPWTTWNKPQQHHHQLIHLVMVFSHTANQSMNL